MSQNMCEICSQDTTKDNRTCLDDNTDKKPVICMQCSYDISHSMIIKSEEVVIKDEVQDDVELFELEKFNGGSVPNSNSYYKTVYSCKDCDYTCTRTSHFKDHIRTHTGEKPYKCNICNYSSVQSSTLKRHIRTHTGEKPFKCNFCDYSSAQSGPVKNHMRTHTGEIPYKSNKLFKCNACNYSSTRSCSLKRHILTHTGEKPYRCSVCNYSSIQSLHLKRHMRKHAK